MGKPNKEKKEAPLRDYSIGVEKKTPPQVPLLYLPSEIRYSSSLIHFGEIEKVMSRISEEHSFLFDTFYGVVQNGNAGANLVTMVVQDLPTLAYPIEDVSYLGKSPEPKLSYRGFNFFKTLQDDPSTPSKYGTMVQPRVQGDIERVRWVWGAIPEKLISTAEIVSIDFGKRSLRPLDMVVLYDHERLLKGPTGDNTTYLATVRK